MRKKLLLPIAIVAVLLFSMIALAQFVKLGRTNPYSNLDVLYGGHTEAPPNTEPPEITINKIWNSGNNVSFILDVRIEESKPIDNVSSMIITSVYYEADWQENYTYVYEYVSNPSNPGGNTRTELSATLDFVEIPEGKHTLTVYATERGSYHDVDPSSWPLFGTVYYYGFNKTGSSSVSFVIDTTPSVTISSVEDKTYFKSEIQLTFITSEPVSQISYVLDGQENVTIEGNTTLSNLPYGRHNVTVYAEDVAGHVGASETVFFNIDVPFPTATVAVASGVSITAIGVGLLVYFKKRKR